MSGALIDGSRPGRALARHAVPEVTPVAARPAAPALPAATPLWPLVVVLVAGVFLQRFAVPVAEGQLGFGLVIGLLVAGWGAFTGRLVVEPTRFILYSVMLAAVLVALVLAGRPFSVLSLAMFCLLYLPFILALPLTTADYRRLLDCFQTIALIVAGSGVAQFLVQFVLGAEWMFPFDRVLPPAFFIPGFNLVIEITGGIVKSTGLWLLEPSHLSQLMAVAIVIELARFRRRVVLAGLGIGLFLAFSGTGLLLLAVFLPVLLIASGRGSWLVAGLVLAVPAFWLLADTFPFSYFVSRLSEFSSPQASGSMRFFGPYRAAADVFAGRPDLLLAGVGPGGMADAIWYFDYAVQDSSWLKLVVEYGLVGAVPFAVFYAYCLFAGCLDRRLAAALLFQVLFLGGFLLGYHVQFLVLALVVWPRLEPAMPPRPMSGGPCP